MALEAGKFKIGQFDVKFKDTKSPDDILWLNRGVARNFQVKRAIIVALIILVTTIVAFYLFSVETNAKIYIKYRASPPGVDCDALYRTYDSHEMQFMAGLEYIYLEEVPASLLDLSSKISSLGALPCFCKKMDSEGNPPDEMYSFSFGRDKEIEEPICES